MPHDTRGALLSSREFASRRGLRGGANDIKRFPDVDAREYKLLHCEARHLDLFNILVSFSKAGILRGIVSTEERDLCRDMEGNAVDDDHPFDAFEQSVIRRAKNNV